MSPTAVHTEKALEDVVEAALLERGWLKGDPAAYDRERALDPTHLFAFLEEAQPELWSELRSQHGAKLEPLFLDTLEKFLDTRGTLDVLRHGIKFYGRKIDLAYFRPATSHNPEAAERYRKNRLVVTRQVKFNPKGEDSVDLVLFLNGLPVATVELKNHFTGQNVWDAVAQYKRRDPAMKLFRFRGHPLRALVHFAVDPELVYMTTRLAGKETFFLPFNRGKDGGAGNPPHPSGYPSGYLWEEVWVPESLLDILGHFMHLQRDERWVDGKKETKETLLFPRYPQLDAVRRLVEAARREGPG